MPGPRDREAAVENQRRAGAPLLDEPVLELAVPERSALMMTASIRSSDRAMSTTAGY